MNMMIFKIMKNQMIQKIVDDKEELVDISSIQPQEGNENFQYF